MRIIGHIDMDAFFAAIEEHDSPQFKGMPIVVGSDPKEGKGRGVVSTANYEARKFGIHSAMPITRAWRLAQEGKSKGGMETIFLPSNSKRYGEVSSSIINIISKYVKIIEQVSIDEAYLDLSFAGSFNKAQRICEKIKREIKLKEGLTASVGIGPNKLIAKIASDFNKPDGLTVVMVKNAEEFISRFNIRKIPGIGPKTEKQLNKLNIKIVEQLKKLSEDDLYTIFGEWGLELYDRARGKDSSELVTEWTAKSIGEQETFEIDTLDPKIILPILNKMSESVLKSMVKDGFKSFGKVVLIVRFEDFNTVSRSRSIDGNNIKIFKNEISKMILPFFDFRENPRNKKLRLVGVRLENLS